MIDALGYEPTPAGKADSVERRNSNVRKRPSTSKAASSLERQRRMKVTCLRRPDRSYPQIRLETPFHAEDSGEITPAFKVCVRIKPLTDNEAMSYFDHDGYSMMDRHFQLDGVFEEDAVNRDVYASTLKPLIKQIKAGFNVTCFAYGMTGAGKTHTMFGQRGE
jgi:hypothetical protein